MPETNPGNQSELHPEDAERLEKMEEYAKQLIPPEKCTPAGECLFGMATVSVTARAGMFLSTIAATYDKDHKLTAVSVSRQAEGEHTRLVDRVWQDRYAYTASNHMITFHENGAMEPTYTITPSAGDNYGFASRGLHDFVRDAYLGRAADSFES